MFGSIRWKLILFYTLLIVVAMQLVSFYLLQRIEQLYLEEARTILRTRGSHLARVLDIEAQRGPFAREAAELVLNDLRSREEDAIVFLLTAEQQIVATSLNAESMRGLHVLGEYPVILESMNAAETFDAIWQEAGGRKFYTLAQPINLTLRQGRNEFLVVSIFVREPLDHTYRILREVQTRLLNSTLLSILVTIVLGSFAAQTITRPIQEITSKAVSLAAGNFDIVVAVKSSDEIGKLGEVFNYLTARLRETLAELRNDKTKLEAIFTHMTNGVVAIDTVGVIIHANIRARQMLGLPENSPAAFILERLNFGDVARLLAREAPQITEVALTVPQPIAVRSIAAPFHAADGAVSGIIIVLQDITEEARLETMRQEFVANVSHELKTPLTTIKSYAETLLTGALESRELAGNFITVIAEEADRMDRLVKDLLTLTQLDYQKHNLQTRPVLMDELVLDVLDKLSFAACQRGVRFGTDFAEEVPIAMANPDKVEQILVNIIANSIKYAIEQGEVVISLRVDEKMVWVGIKDDGPGIPLVDQPRIFERFYRVDKARSRELGGTGLGLAIAKQLVEAHGGTIGINSEEGHGTEVYFSLPRHRPRSDQEVS
ncbi:MAG: HAMP domain-containing protein [Peptococcaceae bacterium]|nr:HAMP domain-containing protein [Peptococcaceae bacterium]